MIVGVPKEIKTEEHRVAITPVGTRELTERGHTVLIEKGAGEGSSIVDEEFEAQGATIVPNAGEVFDGAEMVIKVKEPQDSEIEMFRPGQVLFTYLHLAAYPRMAAGLLERDVIAIAYETVQLPDHSLPLLAPMSEIAGRMATQAGAYFLGKAEGGRGVLLGGVTGVRSGKVVVIGGGIAGSNAAVIAVGMQADVVVLDTDIGKLRTLDSLYLGRVRTLHSNRLTLEEEVLDADLVIGTVLVPGASAPKLVTEDMVRGMKRGSVLVDVAIDQGGCFATSRETTHTDPVYLVHDVLHYAVGNIPGAVPHTSTYALTNATLRYAVSLASYGVSGAVERHPELTGGINVVGKSVCHPAVAESLGVAHVPPQEALASV
ncbi:MAG TPA: alanine dehydrogenase [Acidimicrobiia bacterium]|nr:alanine dehydrogenase [Acidimicrobiia bacterium]HYJ23500.1 alanine dehydrogenase [Acidimicrobiia bacterium]